ncbi:hypothetical protein ACA910_002879 [Epithemia clementina (nom. ined.)]
MLAQAKERGQLSDAINIIVDSGEPATAEDVKNLDHYFDLADWAYIESRQELQQNLKECFLDRKTKKPTNYVDDDNINEAAEGFCLLRHDTTALPDYVGHYIAIDSAQKLAVFGIKGTSKFADFLTDLCGLSVKATLDAPFVETKKGHDRSNEDITQVIVTKTFGSRRNVWSMTFNQLFKNCFCRLDTAFYWSGILWVLLWLPWRVFCCDLKFPNYEPTTMVTRARNYPFSVCWPMRVLLL